MKVEFSRSFEKDLKRIRETDVLGRVKKLVEEADQRAHCGMQKRLSKPGYFRIKIGDFRIGLRTAEDTLIFLRCLDRKEIYRHFP